MQFIILMLLLILWNRSVANIYCPIFHWHTTRMMHWISHKEYIMFTRGLRINTIMIAHYRLYDSNMSMSCVRCLLISIRTLVYVYWSNNRLMSVLHNKWEPRNKGNISEQFNLQNTYCPTINKLFDWWSRKCLVK